MDDGKRFVTPELQVIRLTLLIGGKPVLRLVNMLIFPTCGRHFEGDRTVLIGKRFTVEVAETPEEIQKRINDFCLMAAKGSA
jgi:hypothetical protein